MAIMSDHEPATGFGRLFESAIARCRLAIHIIRRRAAARRNRMTLEQLPDHVLRDIGIARCDIAFLSATPERGRGRRRARRCNPRSEL